MTKACVSFKTPFVEHLICQPTHAGDAILDMFFKMEYVSWKRSRMLAIPIVILFQMGDVQNVLLVTILMRQEFALKLMIHVNLLA